MRTSAELDKCQTCGHGRFDHGSPRDFSDDVDESCQLKDCNCEQFVFDSADHSQRMMEGRP